MVISSKDINSPGIQRKDNDIHIGNGRELDIDCGCELALCGLVHHRSIHTQCKIHGSRNNNPMPFWHYANQCPGMEIDYGKSSE